MSSTSAANPPRLHPGVLLWWCRKGQKSGIAGNMDDVGRDSGYHLVQPGAPSRLLSTVSSQGVVISKDQDYATCLGNLVHCLTMLTVKQNPFLMLKGHFLYLSLCPLTLALSVMRATEKTLVPLLHQECLPCSKPSCCSQMPGIPEGQIYQQSMRWRHWVPHPLPCPVPAGPLYHSAVGPRFP